MQYIEINANTEENFQDLEFNIEKYYQDEYGSHIIKVLGQYQGEIVGFEAIFRSDMTPGLVNDTIDNTAFFTEGINLKSIGEYSDMFINVLAKLYGVKGIYNRMTDDIKLTSFCMEGNPQHFTHEDLKFKVFYDDNNDQGLYAELYINICVTRGILEFKEKDIEYRRNIVNSLSGKKPSVATRLLKKVLRRI